MDHPTNKPRRKTRRHPRYSKFRSLDRYGGEMDEFYEWCKRNNLNYRRTILVAIRLFKLFYFRRK